VRKKRTQDLVTYSKYSTQHKASIVNSSSLARPVAHDVEKDLLRDYSMLMIWIYSPVLYLLKAKDNPLKS